MRLRFFKHCLLKWVFGINKREPVKVFPLLIPPPSALIFRPPFFTHLVSGSHVHLRVLLVRILKYEYQ